jgi:hypothetical protein
LARVLVHPLRQLLLLEYHGEPANPGQVARRLHEPLNLVSYHTGVLARHDCIELVRTERRRGAVTHFYSATVASVLEDEQWARTPPQLRRALALGTLGLASDEARRAALDGGFDAATAHLTRSPLELDDEGVLAVARCLRDAIDQLERIDAACRERSAPGRRPFEVVMLGFEPSPRRPVAPRAPAPPGSAPPPPDRLRPAERRSAPLRD